MAKKKTGLYKVEVQWPDGKANKYYYGRNSKVVDRAAREFFREKRPTSVNVIQVGTFAYQLDEPVVPFTADEEQQIEAYYTKEALKFVAFMGKLRSGADVPGVQ